MSRIKELATVFNHYKTYPRRCYDKIRFVKVFQERYPQDHYSKEVEILLSMQGYEPAQRGADLPWWGKEYFSNKKGFRVMVICQDSLTEDAGSVVFAAQFFSSGIGYSQYKDFYKEYLNLVGVNKYFSPNKVRTVIKQFDQWNIDFDYLYITDACKVYNYNSWKDRDFDRDKSKLLLEAEIELCNPNLIILLGSSPLRLLGVDNYSEAVESGKSIIINGQTCVAAPFFIGQGPSGNRNGLGFKRRLEIASNLIKNIIVN